MKHTKLIVLGLSLALITGSVVAFTTIKTNLNPIEATQKLYTLTLDNNDAIFGNYNSSATELATRVDSNEWTINFEYKYLMGAKSKFAQFKSKSGCISNLDPIHYIKSIQVKFTTQSDDKRMEIRTGIDKTLTGSSKIITPEDNKAIFNNDLPNYFSLSCIGNASVVEAIQISYFCVSGDFDPIEIPDINNSTSTEEIQKPDNTPSNTSSEQVPDLPTTGKNATFSYKNSKTDGYVIPTSYTSTGLTSKIGDLNLFSNFITYDYRGTRSLYLKENGQGCIMNTNAINGFKELNINTHGNKDNIEVYGSTLFDSSWVKLNFTDPNKIEINNKYQFFKIQTVGNQPFSFERINVNYTSADSYNNEIYKTKDVALATQAAADATITTTSEPLVNSQKWTILGYAKNMAESQQDVINKDQSGYDRNTDYQIEFNKDVIYDNNLTAYRVSDMVYGDNGNSFRINMIDGSEGPVIYKDAAYTFVEDIAAYIIAFGDVPPNMRYKANKGVNTGPAIDNWGINGRVNYRSYSNNPFEKQSFRYETQVSPHRNFFNPIENTSNYWYNYFESDYGASVGNNEPYQKTTDYYIGRYNTGTEIPGRGALRFVWTKSFTDAIHSNHVTEEITNPYERNIFFSTTHYNDFQEYLNYYGGWSMKFGNTTLGNGWGEYVENNYQAYSPEIKLVTLTDLMK